MYTTHFGLREMPFSITPDPAYLYLSAHHQEALGHLLYGTGQYGGFVQLTGEVGTGKTTIIRTLLEQKLENVDVAVVLNPRQNEQEFVASICDELGVKYPKRGATLKTLVDALNVHLIQAHAENRRTVVIIDEAQNLRPEVLEQVRLLTNLETHKEKLLRIMLVGQPELATLLARPDLRQLAQRITARYHLTPLDAGETAKYIEHRLSVAGGAQLFSARAIAAIHQHSRGVPRLVNILCDRALLGAYAAGVRQVTPDLVVRAAREVGGEAAVPRRRVTLLDAALVAAILGVGAWWIWREELASGLKGASHAEAPTMAKPVVAAPVETPAPAAASPTAAENLNRLLRAAQPLPVVLSRLVGLWNARPTLTEGESLCAALSREKIGCYKSLGDWADLRRLNRPAVLALSSGRGGLQHVLLRQLGETHAVIDALEGPLRLDLEQIDLLWTGEYLMLWRRDVEQELIGPGAPAAAIVWLRQALARAEGRTPAPTLSPVFDDGLREGLLQFQAANGLDRDGLAGARTLIALDNLNLPAGTPTLTAPQNSRTP